MSYRSSTLYTVSWGRSATALPPCCVKAWSSGTAGCKPRLGSHHMEFENIIFGVDAGVARIRFNRPDALNAANAELHARLSQVWRELEADPECYAVVLTGTGRTFSAGGDKGLLQGM